MDANAPSSRDPQMSLVPYSSDSQAVVLQRGNAVVLYDIKLKQLSVKRDSKPSVDFVDCPYCHRPLRDPDVAKEDERGRPLQAGGSFLDPEYFDMLAASQRPSPAASGNATPTKHTFSPRGMQPGPLFEASGSGPRASMNHAAKAAHIPRPTPEAIVPPVNQHQGISYSALNPGYFRQFFREERELGRGGRGVVLLVEHLLDGISLGHFACKRIPVGDSRANFEKVIAEVRMLHAVAHQNLVAYHHTWLEDHQTSLFGPSIPCLWILQDYCNGGDLHRYVLGPRLDLNSSEVLKQRARRKSRGESHQSPDRLREGVSRLNLEEIFSFFQDITAGLHHLHSKGYIHRDLKPSNCLLHHDDGRTRILISDFGEVQAAGATRESSGATGTISYCAPEVLKQDSQGKFGNFTNKSDIFSLGMIVHFMCFGRLPYLNANGIDEDNEDLEELRAEIIRWHGFGSEGTWSRSDLPERLYRFLRKLLSANPHERPSTDEILASIRSGMASADQSAWTADDFAPRLSAVGDADSQTLARPHKPSIVLTSHPPLPSPTRHETIYTPARSQSPRKTDSRPSSPRTTSSMAVSPIRKPIPSLVSEDRGRTSPSREVQQPRLMLPAPPGMRGATIFNVATRLAHEPMVYSTARAVVFAVKLLSTTLPCLPLAANQWLMYTLISVAALDLVLLPFRYRRSAFLLLAHVAILYAADSMDFRCASATVISWSIP